MILNANETALLAINGFGAMQKQEEFANLLSILNRENLKTTIEIGLGRGGSSWAFSKLRHVTDMIAIDLPDGPWGGGQIADSIKYIADNTNATYTYIAGNSQTEAAVEAVRNALEGDLADFLFIDGDHSYAGVKNDYLTYKQFVREGGLIAFHDICEHAPETGCEVKKFWDELKAVLPYDKYSEFICEPTNWGGLGIVKV